MKMRKQIGIYPLHLSGPWGRRPKGYTLMELLVVIIIIALLAAVAVPKYMRSVERSRQAEALNILRMLRMAEIRYQLENGGYTANLDNLDIENPNNLPNRYFDYDVASAGADDFTVRATRNNYKNFFGAGSYTITLDKDGNIVSGF